MILRIFCDTLACHSERSPAETPLGFASCFWGKAPKVRQAQDDTWRCPAGRSRNPITVRIKRDLSRLESRKKSVIYGDRVFPKLEWFLVWFTRDFCAFWGGETQNRPFFEKRSASDLLTLPNYFSTPVFHNTCGKLCGNCAKPVISGFFRHFTLWKTLSSFFWNVFKNITIRRFAQEIGRAHVWTPVT